MKTVSFRIRQDGMTVAQCDGEDAERGIWVYASQYRQDGDITIQHNADGRWKRFAFLCRWPKRNF